MVKVLNILFLNGSPKGKNSITLQTTLYLEQKFKSHNYEFINIGQRIKAIEKKFDDTKISLEKADLIMFIYPVYTFIAPSQVHKFIEVAKANGVNLGGKYFGQITTSKRFYDVTAHKFIEENGYDMGMKYLGTLSADMEDLLEEKGRNDATNFFAKLLFDAENQIYTQRIPTISTYKKELYTPCINKVKKSSDKDVVVVTNASEDDLNLKNMIEDFVNACEYKVRVINVREYNFSGGCLGCLECNVSGKCVYKDGFDSYLRDEIQIADALIIAFTIENHYAHSSLKVYDDRQFCNGHRTVTEGKATGYIISGDYSNESNLKTIVEARSDVAHMYLSGVATDEGDTQKSIKNMAISLNYALKNKLTKPQTFYGVGGSKIFRDLVYLMQGIMYADHKFYKAQGHYDFPHNKKGYMTKMKLIGILMRSEAGKKQMKGKMNQFIIEPYKKIIDEVNK